jgi:hypothetical protein
MPFEKGNRLAGKARLFERTVRRVIHQNPNKMRSIAEKLIDMAVEGNLGAIGLLAERLDGKAPQTVSINKKVKIVHAEDIAGKLAAAAASRLGSIPSDTVQ